MGADVCRSLIDKDSAAGAWDFFFFLLLPVTATDEIDVSDLTSAEVDRSRPRANNKSAMLRSKCVAERKKSKLETNVPKKYYQGTNREESRQCPGQRQKYTREKERETKNYFLDSGEGDLRTNFSSSESRFIPCFFDHIGQILTVGNATAVFLSVPPSALEYARVPVRVHLSKPMKISAKELSFISDSIAGTRKDTTAGLLVVRKISNKSVSIAPREDALAMAFIITKFAFILVSIGPTKGSESVSLIVPPHALANVARRILQATGAVALATRIAASKCLT